MTKVDGTRTPGGSEFRFRIAEIRLAVGSELFSKRRGLSYLPISPSRETVLGLNYHQGKLKLKHSIRGRFRRWQVD